MESCIARVSWLLSCLLDSINRAIASGLHKKHSISSRHMEAIVRNVRSGATRATGNDTCLYAIPLVGTYAIPLVGTNRVETLFDILTCGLND